MHETYETTDCSVFLPNVYFPPSFPSKVYRMLTFVYGHIDDSTAVDTNANDNEIYIAIALAQVS